MRKFLVCWICNIFYQNLLTSLYLAPPIKSFYLGISRHDKPLKALDNKIRPDGCEYRKFLDFSLIHFINKLSTNRESFRVSLEYESTALRGPSSSELLGRVFRGRCTPNCHQVTCLSSTNGSLTTHPVNIADHLNAYFASCFLPPSPKFNPTISASNYTSTTELTASKYRGIYHTPLLMRIPDRLVKAPLIRFLLATNAIDNQQYGFLSLSSVNGCQPHLRWMLLVTAYLDIQKPSTMTPRLPATQT
ncbi:LOW QUALITY PROTEIN: hypothetical protein T265_15363 [Opisthorchis viverrini]|uniref:Uncharacterized protein n=1 Tax=Opisthorchis viverrini TaxID=6198 RepID=A0A074ZAL1_OPIVI|nr:LOW QUALITY PROTEIN: hypothetical protein T265_15363 [Opisthorchis viverrini]KER20255.1 LOW QUALITY PROTEIN: hypothetical protein T265_15363 [Opisthorchis viverrini]